MSKDYSAWEAMFSSLYNAKDDAMLRTSVKVKWPPSKVKRPKVKRS